MSTRRVALITSLAACTLWLLVTGAPAGAATTSVLVADLDGAVTSVTAEHIRDAIAAADDGGHAALILRIDTPGGLDSAMRAIVRSILDSPVPVIAWVAPGGARAGSAGYLVVSAAHVAAMAPGTNIGAATPIDIGGGAVLDKVVNDAAAYAQALAELRGRDVQFALDAVREGRSASAEDARELGVVDLLASTTEDLLALSHGREVTLASGTTMELATRDASISRMATSSVRRFLQGLADPNLAFLFLSLGTLALLFELAHPGISFGGVIGTILVLLSLYALAVLPVNVVGVVLVNLAVGLFVAELFTPGLGALAGGGAVALLLGGLFLFQRPTGVGVDLAVLVPTVVAAGAGVVGIGVLAARQRARPSIAGADGLIGAVAEVRRSDQRSAHVFVGGALWKARSVGGPLHVGDRVRVVDREDLELVVVTEEVNA